MRATSGILLILLLTCNGCALCPPGYLDDYSAVGGKWQRANPTSGRLGSILSDPSRGVSTQTDLALGTTSIYQGEEGIEYDESPREDAMSPADLSEDLEGSQSLLVPRSEFETPTSDRSPSDSAPSGLPVRDGEIILDSAW